MTTQNIRSLLLSLATVAASVGLFLAAAAPRMKFEIHIGVGGCAVLPRPNTGDGP